MNAASSPPIRFAVRIDLNRPKVPAPLAPERIRLVPTTKPYTNSEISGERLFLYYAFPCVDGYRFNHPRSQCGRLSKRDIRELTAFVDNGRDPDHLLMEHCFPEPVCLFGETAGGSTALDVPWPVEMVRDFWRRHNGPTPTMCGEVESVTERNGMIGCVIVKTDTRSRIPILNRYGLPACRGDIAYFHNLVLAEVERIA